MSDYQSPHGDFIVETSANSYQTPHGGYVVETAPVNVTTAATGIGKTISAGTQSPGITIGL